MAADETDGVGEEELDELYAAPLDRFVAERGELARRLKEEGRGDAAAAVRALAKPSVPAWTVNQLARKRKADVRKLLEAGERLRQAQGRGAGPDEFRKATAAERDAVARLVEAAGDVLDEAGRPASQAVLDRVAATLHAAVGDEEGRRLVERGALTRELEPTGFEALAGLVAAAPKERERSADAPKEKRKPARDYRKIQRAKDELAEARDRARRLRRAADDAEREWKRASREAEKAEEAAARAKEQLDEARAR